ncbi:MULTISPECIES: NAD kinase [Mumia]|uniref:NAD kinase n=1 Tax=Mumia TaxID=1546255 RepID=UPI0014223F46|nr:MULTISPECIES: NAD kinase [unclassified Mumia]QMW68031.1 NAD kinase [Mumia sp. ZJ1417]
MSTESSMPGTRRVLILAHTGREEANKVAAEFAQAMVAEGIAVRVVNEDAAALERWGLPDAEVVPVTVDAGRDCELAVVFGGDGTILRAAELVRECGTPLVGVNLGHVGFLAEADVDDLDYTVRRVVARDYTVEERMTVDARVFVDDREVARSWALNEATVEKASRERMLEVIVAIDDRPVSRWGCDGVVCATPTGSTAYNFSAGGPVVWPEVEALLMVPISAHALFARPMVVSPTSLLAIQVIPEAPASGVLWCDGRRTYELPPGARVEVRQGEKSIRLARLHQAPFTDRLVRKFDLPVSGWRGAAALRRTEEA